MSRFCRQQQVDGYVRWCSISVNAVTPSCTQPLLEQSERCPCDDEACHEPCQLAQRWEARGEPHQPAKHCGRTTPYRRQIYSIAFTPVRTVAFTVIATRAAQPLLYWRERAAVHGEEHCVRGPGMGRWPAAAATGSVHAHSYVLFWISRGAFTHRVGILRADGFAAAVSAGQAVAGSAAVLLGLMVVFCIAIAAAAVLVLGPADHESHCTRLVAVRVLVRSCVSSRDCPAEER
eukprot:7314162-Prymnesium_polylepis.1